MDYSVKDYGAYGDGLADDTAAVQAAISADGEPGRLVYFPSGTYRIGSTVTIDRPVRFVCDPGTRLFRPALGYMFAAKSSHVSFAGLTFDGTLHNRLGHLVAVNIPAAQQQYHRDWTLTDCHFRHFVFHVQRCDAMRNDGVLATRGSDLAENVRVVRCTFRDVNSPWPLKFDGVKNFHVDACTFENIGSEDAQGGNAIKVSGGSRDYRLTNNYIRNTYRSGIDLFDSRQGIVTGNTVDGTTDGMGIMIKSGYRAAGDPIELVTIAHNFVTNTKHTGISAETDFVIIDGNQVTNCSTGIRYHYKTGGTPLTPATRGTVTGNVVTRNGYGLTIRGHYVSVIANQSHDNRCEGIYLDCSHCNVIGNGVSRNGRGDIKFHPGAVNRPNVVEHNITGDGSPVAA